MTGHAVVIGVGNPWRGDDAIGHTVAAAVRERCHDVDVVVTDGEPGRLIEAWDAAPLAVVIDAVSTGDAPGTVHRIDPATINGERPTSSHGLGIEAALALGRAIGRLPERLELIGIEAREFAMGAPLTHPVAAAAEEAVNTVVDIVEGRA